jgi:uncharacterized membrane protein YraQ (UPF0718 family)
VALAAGQRAGWESRLAEWRRLGLFVAVLLIARLLPYDHPRLGGAVVESMAMAHEYARDHVLLCLVPALFIAGAISVFVSQASVIRYLGPAAPRALAYSVAAVSGTVLAVCSCTVLPLFTGIHRRGAGLGPAVAFLYSGPAINVLAIILTARVLGVELGLARAVFSIGFAVLIGLLMHALFRHEERERAAAGFAMPEPPPPSRTLGQTVACFALMVGILVFANWGAPAGAGAGFRAAVHAIRWPLTGALAVGLGVVLVRWFTRDELSEWSAATWDFAKQILPLLFVGVLAAGLLLGRPGHEALIPSRWVAGAVGGNSIGANLFAAVVGAFMYFATLTEVPIVQGLMGSGMGAGPALALLLAGPALSLPSMLVIRGVLGTRKTVAYAGLVVALSTLAGWLFGAIGGGR